MRRSLLIALLLVAGCKHDNRGQQGAPDLSAEDPGDMLDVRDDLTGFEASICGTNSKKAEQVGLDLLFVIDNSYSMDYNLKWEQVSAALKGFIGDPKFNGLGVGIQYFPLRAQCNIADYAVPAVAVDVLPTAATNLIASIDSRRMSGGTALVPALTGVLQYAATINVAGSSRKTIVVLATDGAPDDTCLPRDDGGVAQDPIQVSADLVRASAQANPSIVTYVIGVGSGLSALNTIAAAGGGSPTAFLVDTTKDIQSEFRATLDAIRKKALTCNFQIPDPAPGLHIDYEKVNAVFTEPDTMSQTPFVFVGSQADCIKAPTTGWYYDDPVKPTQVVLCEGACDQVRESNQGQIDIVFGCAQFIP
jgi:hypothetical protein